MVNYQREMQRVLEEITPGEPLLLHACCGPCASAVLERLGRHFTVWVYYCNPNIDSAGEYARRREALAKLVAEMPLQWPARLLEDVYAPAGFAGAVAGLEEAPEGGARCLACFALRLGQAARRAKALGIRRLATTLTVSPHKNAGQVNRAGEAAAGEAGLLWLPANFKKADGYRRSIELSNQYGLYRQDYCGCVYSQRN